MTYTPVIPIANWETDRQDLNDALNAMIAAFQAVVPNVIRKQFSEIPASYTGELPLIYLGDITETIDHTGKQWGSTPFGGLRGTLFSGTIHYVDSSPDNDEANTRSNTFADYMRELFTANARILTNGILQQTGLSEAPANQGPLTGFMHLVLDFEYAIDQGRS